MRSLHGFCRRVYRCVWPQHRSGRNQQQPRPLDTLRYSTARPPTDSQARINPLTCLLPGRRHSVRDASSIRRSVIAKKCGRTRAFRITRQVPSDRHSADEAGIDLARRHGRGAARGIAGEMVTSTGTSGRLPGRAALDGTVNQSFCTSTSDVLSFHIACWMSLVTCVVGTLSWWATSRALSPSK